MKQQLLRNNQKQLDFHRYFSFPLPIAAKHGVIFIIVFICFCLFVLRMFIFCFVLFSGIGNHIKQVALTFREGLYRAETASSTSTTKNNQKSARPPSAFFTPQYLLQPNIVSMWLLFFFVLTTLRGI